MTDTTTTELPPITDIRSAALHLEASNVLDLDADAPESVDDENELPSTDELEGDNAPDESLSGDEEEDENDPELPAIAPPESWKKEDREIFENLPDDAKRIIAQRDKEAKSAINRQLNQAAEQRKAVEAQVAQAQQVQNAYAQSLNQLRTQLYPELEQLQNVDWPKLAREDPARYVELQGMREGLQQRAQYLDSQAQAVNAQQQYQNALRLNAYAEEQGQRLIEEIPEFSDPEKATAMVKDIHKTMESYGFKAEDLAQVYDARIVKVLARLAQLEKLDSARKSAQGKKGGQPAPKVLAPGSAPVREDSKNRKVKDMWAQLEKTGNIKDAARLYQMTRN